MNTIAIRDQIETLPVQGLVPYARNSRTHSPEQVAQIAASMREFGFTNPVLIDDAGGIVAGHGRVLAAQSLGLQAVPCLRLTGLSEAQRRAYIIADNKLAENAGWDDEMLRLELIDLQDMEYDLGLIGFDDAELAELLADPGTPEGATDPDAVPEVQPDPISKPGDVWLLGKHRVMCGDSTSIDAVETLMGGEKASLVVTDPPWNVAYGTNLANNAQGNKTRTILNDSMGADKWDEFLSAVVGNLSLVTLPGCPLYCVMGPSEWPAIDKALRDGGFHWSSTIVWAKDQLVISRKDYHTQYEPIWYGWNDRAARLCTVQDRKQSDLWECKRPKSSPLHPTTKPVELIERAVLNSSNAGSLVFEPFGGSGSLLIACEKTGRISRNMELDPKYVDVIVKRWQEFTGQRATLESTGQPFPE